jgi:hypothetical protein
LGTHFLASGINKDATVWLDGDRPLPKYVFYYNIMLHKVNFAFSLKV